LPHDWKKRRIRIDEGRKERRYLNLLTSPARPEKSGSNCGGFYKYIKKTTSRREKSARKRERQQGSHDKGNLAPKIVRGEKKGMLPVAYANPKALYYSGQGRTRDCTAGKRENEAGEEELNF